jgi:hypothetical protein
MLLQNQRVSPFLFPFESLLAPNIELGGNHGGIVAYRADFYLLPRKRQSKIPQIAAYYQISSRPTIISRIRTTCDNNSRSLTDHDHRFAAFHLEHLHDARVVWAFEVQGQTSLAGDHRKLGARIFGCMFGEQE